MPDPLFNQPFHLQRFEFNGVDRGFKLTSDVEDRDFRSHIFIEQDGPAFHLDGRNVGKPVK